MWSSLSHISEGMDIFTQWCLAAHLIEEILQISYSEAADDAMGNICNIVTSVELLCGGGNANPLFSILVEDFVFSGPKWKKILMTI